MAAEDLRNHPSGFARHPLWKRGLLRGKFIRPFKYWHYDLEKGLVKP